MTQLIRSSRRPAASHGCAGYGGSLTVAVAVIAGLFWAPRPAAADDAPTAFIDSLGQQALAVIHRPDLPVDGKAAYFRQLLRQDFDLTSISRFVLGPHWRVASPGERQEFSDLLTQRLIDVYGRRLAQTGEGKFIVTGSRTDPGGVIVTSRIIPWQGAPIAVDWRLAVVVGLHKSPVKGGGPQMLSRERSAGPAIGTLAIGHSESSWGSQLQ